MDGDAGRTAEADRLTILRHQQIAGRGNVDAALAKLKAWKACDE